MKNFTIGLLLAIGLVLALAYGINKHDQNECHYWIESGYDLTPPMKAQCDYWLIYDNKGR
jgi:hypothetical protein